MNYDKYRDFFKKNGNVTVNVNVEPILVKAQITDNFKIISRKNRYDDSVFIRGLRIYGDEEIDAESLRLVKRVDREGNEDFFIPKGATVEIEFSDGGYSDVDEENIENNYNYIEIRYGEVTVILSHLSDEILEILDNFEKI